MEATTPPSTPSPEKQCQYCTRPLKGRTDKRFCNDDCRNNFNRAKRRKITDQAPDTIPEILRVIKRNYQILLTHFNFESDPGVIIGTTIENLKELGFNDKFCTSVEEENGQLWKFCFDRGWCSIGEEVWVRRNPNNARL